MTGPIHLFGIRHNYEHGQIYIASYFHPDTQIKTTRYITAPSKEFAIAIANQHHTNLVLECVYQPDYGRDYPSRYGPGIRDGMM